MEFFQKNKWYKSDLYGNLQYTGERSGEMFVFENESGGKVALDGDGLRRTFVKEEKERANKIMLDALRKYKLSRGIQDFGKLLDTEKVITGQIDSSYDIVNDLRPIYEDFFTKKMLEKDKDMMQILIENRNKLENRFTIDIDIIAEEKGHISTLTISGVLPEKTNFAFADLEEGRSISASSLNSYLKGIVETIQKETEGGRATLSYIQKLNPGDMIILRKPEIKMDFA